MTAAAPWYRFSCLDDHDLVVISPTPLIFVPILLDVPLTKCHVQFDPRVVTNPADSFTDIGFSSLFN